MPARGSEAGRATDRNARFAPRFRAISYKLATSLEMTHCMRELAATYTQ